MNITSVTTKITLYFYSRVHRHDRSFSTKHLPYTNNIITFGQPIKPFHHHALPEEFTPKSHPLVTRCPRHLDSPIKKKYQLSKHKKRAAFTTPQQSRIHAMMARNPEKLKSSIVRVSERYIYRKRVNPRLADIRAHLCVITRRVCSALFARIAPVHTRRPPAKPCAYIYAREDESPINRPVCVVCVRFSIRARRSRVNRVCVCV